MFNRLARAVSIMAFVPGGIELFGVRYEVTAEEAVEIREKTRKTPTIKSRKKKRK
jgi:hypothetical protein